MNVLPDPPGPGTLPLPRYGRCAGPARSGAPTACREDRVRLRSQDADKNCAEDGSSCGFAISWGLERMGRGTDEARVGAGNDIHRNCGQVVAEAARSEERRVGKSAETGQ